MIIEILKKYIDQEIREEDVDEYVLIGDEFEKIAFEKCVEKYGLLGEGQAILVRCDVDKNGNVTVEEDGEEESDYLKWYRFSYDDCEKRYWIEFSDY